MAIGDIIHVQKRSVHAPIVAYTHWYIRQGVDLEWLLLQSNPVDKWNFYDPWGEGGNINTTRELSLHLEWIQGAEVGRVWDSNNWVIPSTVEFPNWNWNKQLCPVISLSGTSSSGRLLRRRIYPFNAGSWFPYDYDKYINNTVIAFHENRSQVYKVGIGSNREARNCGNHVIWSKKYLEWALISTAKTERYCSTQARRRVIRP